MRLGSPNAELTSERQLKDPPRLQSGTGTVPLVECRIERTPYALGGLRQRPPDRPYDFI